MAYLWFEIKSSSGYNGEEDRFVRLFRVEVM